MFRSDTTLDQLNTMSAGTAIATLGIVFTELGPDFLRATMPVDARTHQPYGLLHGGASALLAETLGSTAGGRRHPTDTALSVSKSTPTICAASVPAA